MPKPNSTLIVLLLDRSGSMESIKTDTIGGINRFIDEQKKLPGECLMTFAQFDSLGGVETLYTDRPVADVPRLTEESFRPRGWTPLLDAMGSTINAVGNRLAALAESDRPNLVIFVTVTDGAENASHEFTKGRVFAMVEHQKSKYGWVFLYLGANQDAIREAAKYGIGGTFAMSYDNKGTAGTYKILVSSVGAMRSSGAGGQSINANSNTYGFTDAQRAQALADVVAASSPTTPKP